MSLKKQLKQQAKKVEITDRLSVMFFGGSGKSALDIRVRITNGKSEVVIKKGGLHAHDRTEIALKINNNQFMDFVKLFALLGFKCEVAERTTINYYLPNKVVASLVKAGPIAYLEIEKLSNPSEIKVNSQMLLKILSDLGLSNSLIKTEKEFYKFCDELSAKVDWVYQGAPAQQKKLLRLLKQYQK